jgi:hypothetical protein
MHRRVRLGAPPIASGAIHALASATWQEYLRTVTVEPHSTHQDSHRPGELESSAYAAGRACAHRETTNHQHLSAVDD